MLIKRNFYLNQLINTKNNGLIKIITGVRRCGKSVLLFNLFIDHLRKSKINSNRIIKINLEMLENVDLRDVQKLYAFIKNKTKGLSKCYILIDEIQYVDKFEDLLNSLNNLGHDVYVTGSNSKLLSSDINTSLRGRGVQIKVYPLSFKEIYDTVGGDRKRCFEEYLKYGGYPYLINETNSQNKIKYLKMLENTVATKDIIDRHNIRNESYFNEVYNFLCSNIGSLISAKKIADTLRSNGFKSITVDTIMNYLNYLCDAFLFYKVYRYDIKGKEYLKTLNKYYCVDLGIRNSRLQYRQIEITHSLENIVYLELIRRGYLVDIGKNHNKEIDFIARDEKDIYYIQVSYTLTDKNKREQELSSFYKIDDGYKKIIVVMDEDPYNNIEKGYKKISIYDFLLDEDCLRKI